MKNPRKYHHKYMSWPVRINAPVSSLPLLNSFDSNACIYDKSCIDYDGREYHYFYIDEKGYKRGHRTAHDIDEVLYWAFSDIIFSMACEFELKNRKWGVDSRRGLFQHEITLFSRLSDEWAKRKQKEIDIILKSHPFDDSTGI
jgi:hypothetical protein